MEAQEILSKLSREEQIILKNYFSYRPKISDPDIQERIEKIKKEFNFLSDCGEQITIDCPISVPVRRVYLLSWDEDTSFSYKREMSKKQDVDIDYEFRKALFESEEAKAFQKRIDKVLEDSENLAKELGEDPQNFWTTYIL